VWGVAPLPEGASRRNNVWSEYDDSAYKKKWQKKTSWNKDFLHFRQPAAAFLRLYLFLHDTSQSVITVTIRYKVSSWCFIFPPNTRVKCNIFCRQRPLNASEWLVSIWSEVKLLQNWLTLQKLTKFLRFFIAAGQIVSIHPVALHLIDGPRQCSGFQSRQNPDRKLIFFQNG